MKETLEEKFDKFIENDFHHLCLDVTGMKKDIGWLKWLICGSLMAVIIRLVLLFFGI
jgi:hypothetical protein